MITINKSRVLLAEQTTFGTSTKSYATNRQCATCVEFNIEREKL